MKVLFFSINNFQANGIRLLASLLNREGIGFQICFIDLTENFGPAQSKFVTEIIEKEKPGIICISVSSCDFVTARNLTRSVKSSYEIPVIWGGIHASISPHSCLQYADYVCKGEGESAFIDFIKDNSADIPGIWHKVNNKITDRGSGLLTSDLDSLPLPLYGYGKHYLIKNNNLTLAEDPLLNKLEYHIMASRGCRFNCSYCCSPLIRKLYGKGFLRARSVDHVISEMKTALEKNPRLISFVFFDDNFSDDAEWVDEFCEKYNEKIHMPFSIYLNPSIVKEWLVEKLKKIGLIGVIVGIQSADQYIRKEIFLRNEIDEVLINSSMIFHKHKIDVSYDIIFSEFDTEKSKREGVNLLNRLYRPFTINVYRLKYYPGTHISKTAINNGLISDADLIGVENSVISGNIARDSRLRKDIWFSVYELFGLNKALDRFLTMVSNSKHVGKYKMPVMFIYTLRTYFVFVRDKIKYAFPK